MVTVFNSSSTVDNIIEYEGSIDPITDLEPVLKKTLLKYISHLTIQLKAQEITIKEMSSTFKDTISSIMDKNINAIVTPLHDKMTAVKASVDKINEVCVNPKASSSTPIVSTSNTVDNHDIIKVEPYTEHVANFISDEGKKNELNKQLECIHFEPLSDQREVRYYGDYKYWYTGGTHEPALPPACIKDVIDTINDKYPGSDKINSCLVTRYSDGNKFCPPHSDNERSLSPTSNIFTLSVGASRQMVFTGIKNQDCKKTVNLTDDSLMVFSRHSQSFWKHEIPQDEEAEGIRYSLTFRCIKPYYINSTVIYGDSNTQFLEFGDGEGKFGKWMPGTRIKAQRIQDIPSAEEIQPYQNIVFNVGINDVNRRDRESAANLINKLEGKCKSIHDIYPHTKISLSPLLPTKSPALNKQIWEMNELIVSLSKKHHNLILMNNSIFADSNGCLLTEYGRYSNPNDILHLGRIGLRTFAASIKSYIVGKNPNITHSLNYSAAYKNGSTR